MRACVCGDPTLLCGTADDRRGLVACLASPISLGAWVDGQLLALFQHSMADLCAAGDHGDRTECAAPSVAASAHCGRSVNRSIFSSIHSYAARFGDNHSIAYPLSIAPLARQNRICLLRNCYVPCADAVEQQIRSADRSCPHRLDDRCLYDVFHVVCISVVLFRRVDQRLCVSSLSASGSRWNPSSNEAISMNKKHA